MNVETVVSLCIAACALLFSALSYRRNSNNDNSDIVTQRATITADIRYIRASIDEIKLENRAIRTDLDEVKSKLVEVEASTKSLSIFATGGRNKKFLRSCILSNEQYPSLFIVICTLSPDRGAIPLRR